MAAAKKVSEAPYSRLVDKDPSELHEQDAAIINRLVGQEVVTAKDVQYCKVLLAKAQEIRRKETGGRAAKKITAKPAAKATSKPVAAKGSTRGPGRPRGGGKAGTRPGPKGRAAAASSKAPADTGGNEAEAPF